MQIDLGNLPSGTGLLHRLVREIAGVVEHRDDEIKRLRAIITQLQRSQFGRRSERLNPDQLALGLEDVEADIEAATAHAAINLPPQKTETEGPRHQKLPDHLLREEIIHDAGGGHCEGCGGALHAIGESVSEMLDYVPATRLVMRIRRPKYACRT